MNFLLKLRLYLVTIRFLKPQQVFYYLFYLLKRQTRFGNWLNVNRGETKFYRLILPFGIRSQDSYLGGMSFLFLSKRVDFGENVDWEFSTHGKLWTYHLNYFNYLNQESPIPIEDSSDLIINYISAESHLKVGMEPYCISIRGINWIKFLSRNDIAMDTLKIISRSLWKQYQILARNFEYHLLANHLLENAFSLLVAAYFFNNQKFFRKARQILKSQLDIQILPDGGHYERSPMYHAVVFDRLLDVLTLMRCNRAIFLDDVFEQFLLKKAGAMASWASNMSYGTGLLPAFQDSTNRNHLALNRLLQKASRLNVRSQALVLGESGYRRWIVGDYTIIFDIRSVQPDFQPGHSHAGVFSFVLAYQNRLLVVDPGISTYEFGMDRMNEKSTEYHNTVSINNCDQSELWGSFRVGKRARVHDVYETATSYLGFHDGYYNRFGVFHCREFFLNGNHFSVNDNIGGQATSLRKVSSIHFHPDCNLVLLDQEILVDDLLRISWDHCSSRRLSKYSYAYDYNLSTPATVLKLAISTDCKVQIELIKARS